MEDVQKNCGFELLKADKIIETAPPTAEELRILREEVDPERYVIAGNLESRAGKKVIQHLFLPFYLRPSSMSGSKAILPPFHCFVFELWKN